MARRRLEPTTPATKVAVNFGDTHGRLNQTVTSLLIEKANRRPKVQASMMPSAGTWDCGAKAS